MKHASIGVGVTAICAVFALSGTAYGGACVTGMTWAWQSKSDNSGGFVDESGAISVGCHYPNGTSCDPYKGETSCKKSLPILCAYRDPAAFPAPVGVGIPDPTYYGWAPEVVATTAPVRPCIDLGGYGNGNGHLSAVNAYCQAEFGPNWSVAEFHDSSSTGTLGWDFQAYGGVMDPQGKHFWVDINNQTNGTCWDRN